MSALPPDPDGSNDERADNAAHALREFATVAGVDREDALADLLSDLMHWADRNGMDFGVELTRAMGNYEAETSEVES